MRPEGRDAGPAASSVGRVPEAALDPVAPVTEGAVTSYGTPAEARLGTSGSLAWPRVTERVRSDGDLELGEPPAPGLLDVVHQDGRVEQRPADSDLGGLRAYTAAGPVPPGAALTVSPGGAVLLLPGRD